MFPSITENGVKRVALADNLSSATWSKVLLASRLNELLSGPHGRIDAQSFCVLYDEAHTSDHD
jgi:hypothetical protein